MKREILYDLEQGSPQWFDARAGIVTMSEVQTLMVKGKGPNGLGAGAITLMYRLVGERITGEPVITWDGNAATDRGKAQEPEALDAYMALCGLDASQIERPGLVLAYPYGSDHNAVGYSPDAFVDNIGALEIKTRHPGRHVELLDKGEVPKEHIGQLQGGLWVSGLEWIDFFSYCRGIRPFYRRVYRDEGYIKELEDRAHGFYESMDDMIVKLSSLG